MYKSFGPRVVKMSLKPLYDLFEGFVSFLLVPLRISRAPDVLGVHEAEEQNFSRALWLPDKIRGKVSWDLRDDLSRLAHF